MENAAFSRSKKSNLGGAIMVVSQTGNGVLARRGLHSIRSSHLYDYFSGLGLHLHPRLSVTVQQIWRLIEWRDRHSSHCWRYFRLTGQAS